MKKELKKNIYGLGLQLYLVVMFIGVVALLVLTLSNKGLEKELEQKKQVLSEQTQLNEELRQEVENLKFPVGKAEDLNWVHEEIDTQFEALVQATWRIETGNGTSNLWIVHNNAGGIKGTQNGVYDYMTYETKDKGYQALRDLLEWYVDEFGYDLESIRNLYCQCDVQDLNTFTELFIEEGGVHE